MSSILDSILGAAGQQGPAGQQDPSGGLPPDLASAIQGGGQDPGSDASGGEQSAVDVLDQMIDLAKNYLDVEPDEEDKAVMTACLQNFQKLKAKDQSEADGAMQGKTTPRMVRKAAAAQGGGPGGGY